MVISILERVIAGEVPRIRRFTVEQYHAMIEAGVLLDGEPIELLDGVLVYKNRADSGDDVMTHGERHTSVVRKLQRLLYKVESLGLSMQSQLPVIISVTSEPEPDITVMKGVIGEYDGRKPTASEILLIVEVADSSLKIDRITKKQLFALAGIPSYWIVNLNDNIIEFYSQPDLNEGEYKSRRDFTTADLLTIDFGSEKKLEIAVSEIIS